MKNLKRIVSIILSIIMILPIFSSMHSTVMAAGNVYYVSESGNDLNPGTLNAPFKTIQKAAEILQPGDLGIIRGGTYRETVIPANSGLPNNPIVYKAYPGETVVISGAEAITDWTSYLGNIYVANATMNLGHGNQVFSNGKMIYEARWPNYGSGDLMHPELATMDSGTTSISIYDADMQDIDWTGGTAWVWSAVGNGGWTSFTAPITAYSGHTATIVNKSPDTYNDAKTGAKYFLTGKLAALDSDEEWFYDNSDSKLYVWVKDGMLPSELNVEVKQRSNAIQLIGKGYIEFIGIDVFGSTIVMDDSTNNCTIDDMKAKYISHSFQYELGYASQVNDTGIYLLGNHNTIKNSEIAYSSGNGVTMMGSDNALINNLIHDTNYGGTYASSISLGGKRNLVSHNTAYNSGRSILNGGSKSKPIEDTIVQYNDFYNAGFLSRDLGVVYFVSTFGKQNEIHHNTIHDNKTSHVGDGLYLDNAAHGFLVHHNVIYRNTGTGIHMNLPSEYNLIYNNTVSGGFINNWGINFTTDGFGSKVFNNIFTAGTSHINEVEWSNNIENAPNTQFVNAASGNFRLLRHSPAIDAAVPIGGVTDGFSGSAPDAGAYEYNGADWASGHNFDNPPSTAFSRTETAFVNKLSNPGFDFNNLDDWTKTGSMKATTVLGLGILSSQGNARSSWYSARLGGGLDGIEQTISGLKPNTVYTASAWFKVDSGEMGELKVKDSNGIIGMVPVPGTSGQWVRKSLTFTTGSMSTSVTLMISKTSTGTGYVYGDDIGFAEQTGIPPPIPPPSQIFENENLVTISSGPTESDVVDANASNGSFNWLNSSINNAYVQYTVNVSQPGTYNIGVRNKRNYARGIYQLSIDGINQGSPVDLYNATADYVEYDLGQVTFSTAGNKLFRFTVIGKNPGSISYQLTFDYIKLSSMEQFYENEALETSTSGPSQSDVADANASNGSFNWLNSSIIDAYVQYTVNVNHPGTYNIKVRNKRNYARGIYQLSIDGITQGSPVDLYNATVDYVEYDLGQVTFSTAGNKLFRFTVIGKNPGSISYQLTFDYIKFQ